VVLDTGRAGGVQSVNGPFLHSRTERETPRLSLHGRRDPYDYIGCTQHTRARVCRSGNRIDLERVALVGGLSNWPPSKHWSLLRNAVVPFGKPASLVMGAESNGGRTDARSFEACCIAGAN